ncbi:hypothetical protein FA09DRAFT_329862 [Tilletiopsis washingtonensis]|uniref:TPX2 C-terminal domain-containing protein n=1 Tax=Tilletiopsis washingtonensis TaxID=58919 RepID=A0A316ZDB5_9BASI|nr:hypothetical protein FA09DRAFT_329862 [Tilletiopsis washingtonensis]PWN98253.1 hypothetical protein FA09DRAFT_329862 [Tilletiopsis washingtonensis]
MQDASFDSLVGDDDSLRDLMPSAQQLDVSPGLLRHTPRAGPSRLRPIYVSPDKERTLGLDDTLQQQENMPPGTPSLPAHRRPATHLRPPASPALAALMRLKDLTSSRAESRKLAVASAAAAARPADEMSMLFDASLQLGPASPSSPLKRTLGSASSRAANGVRGSRRQPRASMFRTKADQVVDLSLLGEEELERLAWEDMGESEPPAQEQQEKKPVASQQAQLGGSEPSPARTEAKQRKGRALRKRRSTIVPTELAASAPASPAPVATAAVDSPRRSTRNTPVPPSPQPDAAPSEPFLTQAAPKLGSPSKLPRRAVRTTTLGTATKHAEEPAEAVAPRRAPAEAKPAAPVVAAAKSALPAARISHLLRKREQQRAQQASTVMEAQMPNELQSRPETESGTETAAPADVPQVAELIEEQAVVVTQQEAEPDAPSQPSRPATPELLQASSTSLTEPPRDVTPRRRTRSSMRDATPASSFDAAPSVAAPADQDDAPGPSLASRPSSHDLELSPPARPVRARASRPCASGITIPRSPFARSRRESAVRSAAARALATARSSAVTSRKDARASLASSGAATSTAQDAIVGVPQGFRLSSTGMLVAVPRAQAFARQTRHQQAARARAEEAAASERERTAGRIIPRANPVPAWMQQRKAQLALEEEARLEAERARVRAEELGKGAASLRASARRVEAPAPAGRKSRGAFVSSVDARLRERAAWELKRAGHEKVLEAEREQARSERMQREELQYREARARAVPKANPVPASIYGHSTMATKTRRA